MTPDIFNKMSTVATVLPVRDVAASVRCYRDKLGLEPIRVGSDGPDHPIAAYAIAGGVVVAAASRSDTGAGRQRSQQLVVAVMNCDLEPIRRSRERMRR